MNNTPAQPCEETLKKFHQFWNTQPVPKMDEEITMNEAIEPDLEIGEVRAEPYSLPYGFSWDTLNLNDPVVLEELYTLLKENYVEDGHSKFRYDYQPEFIKWALHPPGWRKEWHCGIRVVKSGCLVAFISAIPATLKIYEKTRKMVEINFLCVHKKLRSKKVAPVLIREITRRTHLTGLFQAVYTAGIVLPKPVGTCQYWQRPLNLKKMIEVHFPHVTSNTTIHSTLKFYKLPDSPKTPGFRKLTKADVPQAHTLLAEYLRKFDLSPEFTEEDFVYWFMPRTDIVDSFVVERDGKILDFVSYYTIPTTILHHPVHKSQKGAFSFYNVSTETPLVDLMKHAIISAKQFNADVFNALDFMDNRKFLEALKFNETYGDLKYYLYNWKCPFIAPDKMGLILH